MSNLVPVKLKRKVDYSQTCLKRPTGRQQTLVTSYNYVMVMVVNKTWPVKPPYSENLLFLFFLTIYDISTRCYRVRILIL